MNQSMQSMHPSNDPGLPTVSVVIPCRNERAYIGACLDSLLQSDQTGYLLQVIVADGMSDDGTQEVLADYARRSPNIHWIENPARITPVAMNLGFHHLPFDYGMIMGAHSTLEPDYIRLCLEKLQSDPAIGCTGGLIRNSYADSRSMLIGKAMSSRFGVGNAYFRTGGHDGPVDTVGTAMYPKHVLDEVGYFDEQLVRNQDDELNFRVSKAGYTIWLLTQPQFNYVVRAQWGKLWRQYRQYGYWKVFVNRKHKAVTTLRQLVPAAFVAFLVVGAAVSWLHPAVAITYLALLGLYLLLGCAVSVKAVGQGKAPLLMYTFLILHLSYGLGYWQGIWQFLILRKRPASGAKKLSR
jgi:GT2 family glycosyltransferase